MSELKEKLRLLPDSPGVYIMLDKDGVVIYVGKARVLKNRVRQYFHTSAKPEKVAAMVENIADFYYIITRTEIDALALENNLIKKYKPKYNILLKDDKTYPYIKPMVMDSDAVSGTKHQYGCCCINQEAYIQMGCVEQCNNENTTNIIDYGKCSKEYFQTDWNAFSEQA